MAVKRPSSHALLAAVIPAPSEHFPDLADLDLSAFWRRFQDTAPLHLRLGFRLAVVVLGHVLPRLMGNLRSLGKLNAEKRDRVLLRAARLPVAADLLEVAKIIACMAYFDAPSVQMAIRSKAGQ